MPLFKTVSGAISSELALPLLFYVTRDSDTTFKVKRSKVNLQGRGHVVAASRTHSLLNKLCVREAATICPANIFSVRKSLSGHAKISITLLYLKIIKCHLACKCSR